MSTQQPATSTQQLSTTQLSAPLPFGTESEQAMQLLEKAEYWTETNKDITGYAAGESIFNSRFMMISGDYSRTAYWQDPPEIDSVNDVVYVEGSEDRAHRLDWYYPHDALVRGGHNLPLYIDIHGGGFCYGYKELNRNFNTHLAAKGFVVCSINYRLAPRADLLGQLYDIQQALKHIRASLAQYPCNPHAVFLTGDSAGGCLALLTLAIEKHETVARIFGFDQASGIDPKGAALISGVYDLVVPQDSDPTTYAATQMLAQTLGGEFFEQLTDDQKRLLTIEGITDAVELPALYLQTSSDDFIEDQTLGLAAALAKHTHDVEIHDEKVAPTQTLGHVFPVCMTWLEESNIVLNRIRDFTYARVQY